MHDTAMLHGKHFFSTYLKDAKGLQIVDIGAQDFNGSLRSVAPKDNDYIGLDFSEGKGVDIILSDPYALPFEDCSIDVVVSSSCYEHSEFFWLSFTEALRVLKPTGLLYINVPSNGSYHRYPVDCWRFYPDSGIALEGWGNRSGYECALLESFTGFRKNAGIHDFVGVFVKDKKHASKYPTRIQDHIEEFMNGRSFNSDEITNYRAENTQKLLKITPDQLYSILEDIKANNPVMRKSIKDFLE